MSYSLEFVESALKEWRKLAPPVRDQFKKKLAERLQRPRVPSASLLGMKDRWSSMLQKMADPFIIFVVAVLGSLALSVVLGTIDACLSKGSKPTLSIRVGARCMALFLYPPPGPAMAAALAAAATTSIYTFWSKVFCSIGGCWAVIGPVVFVVYLTLLLIFT